MSKIQLMIDFGTFNTKILAYKKTGETVNVLDYKIISTPENIITEEDSINADPTFVENIKAAISKMAVKTKNGAVTISNSGIIMREIYMPKLDDKRLKQMISIEAKKQFMVNIDEFVLDYKITGTKNVNNSEQYVVMLVAVPTWISQSYVDICKAVGISVDRIDFCSNSVCKLIANENFFKQNSCDTCAVIDIGHENTDISICYKGGLKYSRSISLGSAEFERAIEEAKGTLYNSREIKENYEFFNENNADDRKLQDSINGVISYFYDQINRILEFYTTREHGNKIDMLLMSGGGGKMKNIDKVFQTEFNIETRVMGEVKNMKISKYLPNFQNDINYLANCVGGAL